MVTANLADPLLLCASVFFKLRDRHGVAKVVGDFRSSNNKTLKVVPCRHTACCDENWQNEIALRVQEKITGSQEEVRLEHCQRPGKYGIKTEFFIAHRPSASVEGFNDSFCEDSVFNLGKHGVSVVCLGGVGEVGSRSCTVIYIKENHQAIMIDCGINIAGLEASASMDSPLESLPDFDWFNRTEARDGKIELLGIFITHGHADHHFGLSYFLQEFFLDKSQKMPPIFASRFTGSLVGAHLREKIKNTGFDIRPIILKLALGSFKIEAIPMPHSIMGNLALGITCQNQRILFSSDFKLRKKDPIDYIKSLKAIREFGTPDLLLCDATSANRPGFAGLESEVEAGFIEVIDQTPGRIIITFFSTNLDRLQIVNELCHLFGKTGAYLGASFGPTIQAGEDQGITLSLRQKNISDANIICVTGCQANTDAVATRLAEGEQVSGLKIGPTDTIIHSALPIHGRDLATRRMIEGFCVQGATIWLDHDFPGVFASCKRTRTHVHGHEGAAGLTPFLRHVRPKYLLPYHSSPEAMLAMRNIAVTLEMAKENILLPIPQTITINL